MAIIGKYRISRNNYSFGHDLVIEEYHPFEKGGWITIFSMVYGDTTTRWDYDSPWVVLSKYLNPGVHRGYIQCRANATLGWHYSKQDSKLRILLDGSQVATFKVWLPANPGRLYSSGFIFYLLFYDPKYLKLKLNLVIYYNNRKINHYS